MNFFVKYLYRFINKVRYSIEAVNRMNVSNDSFIHSESKIKSAIIKGKVNISEGVKIVGNVTIQSESMLSIGKYSSINGPNTDINSKVNPIDIGAFTSIARNVSIQEFNHKFSNLTSYHIHQNVFKENRLNDIYSNGSIQIGNDVWIGTHCVILSGAKIGNGAVVAANSVVAGEVPPYAIVGGTPAKVIKYRFDPEIIELLQKLEWWNWPIAKIKLNKKLFSEDITRESLEGILKDGDL